MAAAEAGLLASSCNQTFRIELLNENAGKQPVLIYH